MPCDVSNGSDINWEFSTFNVSTHVSADHIVAKQQVLVSEIIRGGESIVACNLTFEKYGGNIYNRGVQSSCFFWLMFVVTQRHKS